MSFSVEVAGKSDVGCVRANNEDNFGYDSRYGVFVVCDGMGGQAAGEVASKLAVDAVLEYFRHRSPAGAAPLPGGNGLSPLAAALAAAIHSANQKIVEAASQRDADRGMGSTIAALLLDGQQAAIAHVGDSRVYLLRQGELRQLTQDHSLVMEQVRRGLITREQAERSELQNIITRALGSEETSQPDFSDLEAQPGDLFLLASDGLTRLVPDQRILELVSSAPGLDQACEALIAAARGAGGDDNITCLLVHLAERPWYRRLVHEQPQVHESL